ncbi:MAG: hypothetical protein ACOYVD_17320 [Bacillota bacterium]
MSKAKKVILVLLFAALLFPNAVVAAEGMELKNFSVDIWPEYDDPRVLVIYQGTFVNTGNSDFKGYVKFNIPKFEIPKEGQISMACEIVNGGNHSCQPYNLEDKGDYVELSWKTTRVIKPGQEYPVFLEFYYLPFSSEPQKSFNYDFISNYDIQAITVNIKQPLRAEDFKVTPQPLTTNVDTKGFSNNKLNYSDISAQEKLNYKIEYIKNDNEPSIQKEQPQQTSEAKTQDTGLQKTNAWKNPLIYTIIGASIIIMGGFIVFGLLKSNDKKRLNPKSKNTNSELLKEKKKLRQMLTKGQISEQTYRELIEDLEEEYL